MIEGNIAAPASRYHRYTSTYLHEDNSLIVSNSSLSRLVLGLLLGDARSAANPELVVLVDRFPQLNLPAQT
ncbi:hypothetical protein PC116_g22167 [Phytophthora cactorum]|nr:hypothetical protein Pcac1_g18496 [Phytophthora cactorum]KAG3130457.1 hypothetical protein C6341_g23741 [Phytophthora cactorum]KAG4229509.1 hypothetical protein PC116_g22167 [Phytophthora cactorum]